uniref:Uncharacterized protein n=1 Tax=Arundo donax TaxID=35708 RepID=A0A0A9C5X6_ARUDO
MPQCHPRISTRPPRKCRISSRSHLSTSPASSSPPHSSTTPCPRTTHPYSEASKPLSDLEETNEDSKFPIVSIRPPLRPHLRCRPRGVSYIFGVNGKT